MSTFVYYQFYVFLATFYGGIIIAFTYDLYRVFRLVFNPSKLATIIQDIFYWIVVTIIAVSVLLYSNEGVLRGYTLLGFGIGAIIYNALLSYFVQRGLLKGVKYIKRGINKLIKGMKYPVNWIAVKYAKIINRLIGVFKPFYIRIKRIALPPKRVLKDIKKYLNIIITKK